MSDANAPIDDAILQAVARTLRTDDRVEKVIAVSGDGTDDHKHLAVTLDPTRYPESIRTVRLEIQWYRNDGFNIHYMETHTDDGRSIWQCRWDRQSSTHSTREHFHPPPDAGTPTNTQFPNDYLDVLSMVFAAIRARIDELWQDDENAN